MFTRYPITKFGQLEEEIRELESEGVPLPFIVENFLGKDGGEMEGSLNMGGQPIQNIPDPINPQDAVNKKYVDSTKGINFFKRNRDGDYTAKQSLNMDGQKLQGLPLPVDDNDAATKIYTDTLTEDRRRKLETQNPFNIQNGIHEAKDKINMKGFKIEGVGFPDLPSDVATVEYVDGAAAFERKNGGLEAKEHIYIGKKKLGGLRAPKVEGEATNKKYVDDEVKKN